MAISLGNFLENFWDHRDISLSKSHVTAKYKGKVNENLKVLRREVDELFPTKKINHSVVEMSLIYFECLGIRSVTFPILDSED